MLMSSSEACPSESSNTLYISLINAVAYMCTICLPGSEAFQLSLAKEGILGKTAKPDSKSLPDLSSIPEDYHKFADVVESHDLLVDLVTSSDFVVDT